MKITRTGTFIGAALVSGLCLFAVVAAIAGSRGDDGPETAAANPTQEGHTVLPPAPTAASDQGASSDKAKSIHEALLKGSFSSPKGFTGPKLKDFSITNDQKNAGAESAVQITFSSPSTANVIYYILATADQSSRFEAQVRNALPGGAAGRKFLPYLTDADCAETSDGGTCALATGQVVIVATASKVDSGAAALLLAGKAMADGGGAPPPKPPSPQLPTPCGGTVTRSATANCEGAYLDGCALMTPTEAASIMHGDVGAPSRDGNGNCTFVSKTVAGDSLSVQIQTGGSSEYDLALETAVDPRKLTGIGDKAFITASRGLPMAQVHILKGGRYVIVFVINSRDSALNNSATEAAKIVAARIK